MIYTEKLGKRYSKETSNWALRNISVQLPAAKFIALIGPNGAGKSTFFHLLSGMIRPTEGNVYIKKSTQDILLGWASQATSIDWYLSVFDNVRLGARLAGFNRSDSYVMTEYALELVGLEALAGQNPDQLSGGQQKRVQIARALVHNPQILLLDEPTTGLDPLASDGLMQNLKSRANSGDLVIVSSHDLSLLENYCDLIMFIENGQLVAFEHKDVFLKRFSHMETILIQYRGVLESEAVLEIESKGFEVINGNPIRLTTTKGMTLNDITDVFSHHIDILNIQRQPIGLRETYVNIAHKHKIN